MDTKKLLFKWFDKVILLMALVFVAWAANRVNPPKRTEDLEKNARNLISKVRQNMDPEENSPPDLPKLDQAKALKKAYEELPETSPCARTAWFPPRDMVHLKKVMRTQETAIEFDHPIKEKPREEPFAGSAGKVSLAMAPDQKSIKIRGEREGDAKITLYDSAGQRHVVVVKVEKFVPDPQVYQPKKPEVALVPGTKTIKITWDPPDSVDERAPIKGYYVYRKKEGEKEFARLPLVTVPETSAKGKLPGGAIEDSNTAFDTTYIYTATSYAPGAKPPESKMSAETSIYIPSDVTFFLKGATPDQAQVKVYKWQQGQGWTNKTFFVAIGEEIGQMFQGGQMIDGKYQKVKIDYRTGSFLVDVEPKAPMRVMFGTKAMDFADSRIVYQDGEGSLQEKWRFEPDVAPWAWFNESPPQVQRRPRAAARRAGAKKGEGTEEDMRAAEEEERLRAEEEAAKREREEDKRGGAKRPEEIR